MGRQYDSHAKQIEREHRRIAKLGKVTTTVFGATKATGSSTKKEQTKMASNSFDINAMYEQAFGFMPRTPVPEKPKAPPAPVVKWDDVIGQAEAKAAVREAIEGVTKHAELYKRYGRRPTKGILLFGPPGNGKTMLGKAAASAMAEQHGQEARESGFIYVKGPELLSMYVGQVEQKIRNLFAKAAQHKAQHKYPAIIFIDEAESVLGHRRDRDDFAPVPAFLVEMDGMVESSAIVLLATNRPNSLDSAVIREGRIDRKIMVGRPTQDDALAFFEQGLRGRPLAEGVDVGELALEAATALYNSNHILYRVHLADGKAKPVTLGHFTSGAQIAFLVDAAASFAIDREIATGQADGIRTADFVSAVERTLREQRDIEHPSELAAFCEPFAGAVTGLERVRADGQRASLIAHVPEGVKVKLVGASAPGASC